MHDIPAHSSVLDLLSASTTSILCCGMWLVNHDFSRYFCFVKNLASCEGSGLVSL